jgi:hypothetical protein
MCVTEWSATEKRSHSPLSTAGHSERMLGAACVDANTIMTASERTVKLWTVHGAGKHTLVPADPDGFVQTMPCHANGLHYGSCEYRSLCVWRPKTKPGESWHDDTPPCTTIRPIGNLNVTSMSASPSGTLLAAIDTLGDTFLLNATEP